MAGLYDLAYGDYNDAVEAMIKKAGYTSARSFTTGNWVTLDDFFHMWVTRIYENTDLDQWKNMGGDRFR